MADQPEQHRCGHAELAVFYQCVHRPVQQIAEASTHWALLLKHRAGEILDLQRFAVRGGLIGREAG